MNFGVERESSAAIQLAPLIDIVFLLLIWLITSYAMARAELNLSIQLPRSDTAVEVPRAVEDLVVDIAPDGTITHQREPITLAALESRLVRLAEFARDPAVGLEPGVILRVDEQTPYKAVAAVLDVCGRAAVRRVFFASAPPAAAPAR